MMMSIRKKGYLLLMGVWCLAILAGLLLLTTNANGESWGVLFLLLLCPALHFLMHRNMHGHDNQRETPQDQQPPKKKDDDRRSHDTA